MRIGQGYDVHKFAEGRDLILGGVTIPYEMGLLGHSDADVLTHAVIDALLGAAGLGDIGEHFYTERPPDRPERLPLTTPRQAQSDSCAGFPEFAGRVHPFRPAGDIPRRIAHSRG